MSRQSIQKIKAMLLCIVYALLFVNTVNTKTLVFVALTYSTYISVNNFLNIQPIFNPKKVLESTESGLYKCIQQCQHCQHILPHNFLDIQLIFNPFEGLESSESGLFNCFNNVDMHSIECIIFCIECHNLYQQCQHI